MKKLPYKSFILAFFSVIYFAACSSSAPEVNNVIVSVVFEYDDFVNIPVKRMSVVVDSGSDIHRAQKLTVSCAENNYTWISENLIKFQNNKKTYAGYTDFVMPENKNIPQGKYKIVYENADNQTIEVDAKINYEESLAKLNAEKCEKKLKDKAAKLKIGIYDSENKLVYFGDKKNELSTKEGILKAYRTASYYRSVWSTQNDSILCIMPKEYLSEENNASENK